MVKKFRLGIRYIGMYNEGHPPGFFPSLVFNLLLYRLK